MKTTSYLTAAEFLQKAQAHLEENEAANNLMIGLCLRLQKHPERIERQPYFATVEDAKGLAAAAVMTPPFSLIVHSARKKPQTALEAIAKDLLEHHWPVPGVNGQVPLPEQFSQVWTQLTGARHEQILALRAFELRKVAHPKGAPGSLRVAKPADTDLIASWMQAFHDEATPHDPPFDAHKAAKTRICDGDIFLWDDGKPVTMAAKARPTRNGITVNLVYTPPQLRRKGYATACVAALSQKLLDEGWQFCALFTDLANPTSNSIYQQIGYKPVCDYALFRFTE